MEQPPCFNTTRNGNTPDSGSRPDETRHFSECAASARPSRTCNAGPALVRSSCSSAGEAHSSGERSAGLEARTLRAVSPQDGRQSERRVAQGGGRRDGCEKKSRALRGNPLPWASIDAYLEWIAALLSNYKRIAAASTTADGACSCEKRARARRALEETLLPTPLRTASIKYDGACFGKLETGELVGRKQTLGAACAESNDPTCGESDGGTGVTAPPPHRADLPPCAHNCRTSAHVYATGDCGDERQRQWRRRNGAGRFFFWFWWCAIFLIQENCTQVGTASGTPAHHGQPARNPIQSRAGPRSINFFEPTAGQFLNSVAS